MNRLLIFGLGYTGRAIETAAQSNGYSVSGTTRAGLQGSIRFDDADASINSATHLLITAAPVEGGDPILARFRTAILTAPALRWIGYLSSTVVYGDRGGAWVDEDTPPNPTQARGIRRLEAEKAWAKFSDKRAVDIFRVAGIYGPGRSAFDVVRTGRARPVIQPGHQFGRIHRDDIARAVIAAMEQTTGPGTRYFNLTDDEPAESAAVIAEAGDLLGVALPPALPFAEAEHAMTPLARSFWAENRKVSAAKTKAQLGLSWLFPTYREGLRAILVESAGPLARSDGTIQQQPDRAGQ